MIRIGLGMEEKRQLIRRYARDRKIERIIIFYPERFPLSYDDARHVEYKEIIMYRTFYPLLEAIDRKTLLVFNECLRTRNRSDLAYNCAHHYCNQTGHKIVFEAFPFIEDTSDFMILLDLLDKGRYKGKSFSWDMLKDVDLCARPLFLTGTACIDAPVTDKDRAKYEAKKKSLFDNLGEGDPDTIPRQLHVFAGNFKRASLSPGVQYVARNARFKLPNVTTYADVQPGQEYTVVDFPHRRIDFCDFLRVTGQNSVHFVSTGLPVDVYYFSELIVWMQRLGGFYAKTGLC